MYFFWQKYKYLLIPAALAIFLFGGLFLYRYYSRPRHVAIQSRPEITLTILPGWDLRQVAEYLVSKGLATSTKQVYEITGEPAKKYKKGDFFGPSDDLIEQNPGLSMEGYLAPETIRVFADANLADGVIDKFYFERKKELTPEMFATASSSKKTMHQILTMASIVEKEAPTSDSMAMVADIFWRRLRNGWPLQSCATVNYVTGKSDPAVSAKDRAVDSLFNTYKYPGLPPGPISNPSLKAIKATLNPIKNDYWYFMSGKDGQMHYAKTLDEHNRNVYKFLR